ncbi:hypothetical protein [Sphingobium ummariense]|nr:hypothetical protein [Sphingobium ummariense]
MNRRPTMHRQPGFSLPKMLAATFGLAAVLLVMIAPRAASHPVGCEMAKSAAAECVRRHGGMEAAARCTPYLA